jgi:hypothetical protein
MSDDSPKMNARFPSSSLPLSYSPPVVLPPRPQQQGWEG